MIFSLVNFDLLLVAIAVAGAATLGITVFVSNTKSATAWSLLAYAGITIGWSIANYASYRLTDSVLVLWAIRLVLFFAAWHALCFLMLAVNFPSDISPMSRGRFWTLVCLTAVVSVLTLTPVVYQNATLVGSSIMTETAPGIIFFGLMALTYIGVGVVALLRKLQKSGEDRQAYELLFAGVIITFFFLLGFDFLFPVLLNNNDLIPYGGLFQLPLIGFTAYAILRSRLFNIKIAGTSVLIFMLAVVSAVEVVNAASVSIILFRVAVFLITLLVGALLIQSVYLEVEQRELIQHQEQELEEVNRKQEALLHFISHEIKGYLAKGQNAFAAISEGDYGEAPEGIKKLSQMALAEMRAGTDTVTSILDAANLKQGTVSYTKKQFDLAAAVQQVIDSLTTPAKEKGIQLVYHKPITGQCMVEGDEDKIRQSVVRNLIDNSVKYTPSGSVTVTVLKDGATVRLEVQDTGVGITPEDMSHLFTEGGHGKDSIKINVHSTGFGLYIAKQIVEAHQGKIWAESDGQGKGSHFFLELPMAA